MESVTHGRPKRRTPAKRLGAVLLRDRERKITYRDTAPARSEPGREDRTIIGAGRARAYSDRLTAQYKCFRLTHLKRSCRVTTATSVSPPTTSAPGRNRT